VTQKRLTLFAGLVVALNLNPSEAQAEAPPAEWIDPATGHRVIRLSGDGGGSSLYFHQNAYTPTGDRLVVDTRDGIAVIDLTKLGREPVKAEVVVPGARAIATAWRTSDVYYRKAGTLYATNLETKAERKVLAVRGSIVNADETLVIGIENDPDAAGKVKELGLPMLVTTELVNRDEPPGRLWPGGRSLAMVVTDVKTGASKKVHCSTEWLNHLQASPADPQRLLFCHEGAWHQVDRVWTIRTDGKDLKLLHKRTVRYEIAGHEFFSHDGKWVWYDLQTPRSKEFWLAGVNVETGERVRAAWRSVWVCGSARTRRMFASKAIKSTGSRWWWTINARGSQCPARLLSRCTEQEVECVKDPCLQTQGPPCKGCCNDHCKVAARPIAMRLDVRDKSSPRKKLWRRSQLRHTTYTSWFVAHSQPIGTRAGGDDLNFASVAPTPRGDATVTAFSPRPSL